MSDEANITPEEEPKAGTCPIALIPMGEWVKKPDTGSCKPCAIGPVVQWYHSELEEQGKPEIAKRLEAKVVGIENDDPDQMIAICEELDAIKAEVEEPLRNRLLDFDCEIQSLDLEEISHEATASPEDSPAS